MVGRWNFLLKWPLFRGRVNFRGCNSKKGPLGGEKKKQSVEFVRCTWSLSPTTLKLWTLILLGSLTTARNCIQGFPSIASRIMMDDTPLKLHREPKIRALWQPAAKNIGIQVMEIRGPHPECHPARKCGHPFLSFLLFFSSSYANLLDDHLGVLVAHHKRQRY